MFYYISINSWNLLESFVSESISPFSFYQDRGYGNNLSRYIDGANERINYLILSTEKVKGDYVLKVDDVILDKSNIMPVKKSKTLFTYSKTIYYKKGHIAFLFSSNDLLESLVAESQILFEVKCVEKYRTEFVINTGEAKPLVTNEIAEAISFQRQEYIAQDKVFDGLKGMIVAYTHAIAFAEDPVEQRLSCQLRDLKNSFLGLNTQIMISESAVLGEDEYMSRIKDAKVAYNEAIKVKTNLFDILMQQFSEIVKLAKARANELSKKHQVGNASRIVEGLMTKKEELESKLYNMEYRDGISDLLGELNSIKSQERDCGIKRGKTREYFKKGTWEYERKQYLKNRIKKYEENNYEYKSIKQNIGNIKQQIAGIEAGGSVYDTTLGALFVRVSDIMNELINKVKTLSKHGGKVDYSCLSLKNSAVGVEANASVEEKAFLDIIVNEALESEQRVLSDDVVLNLIVKSANKYKCLECANTERGKLILSSLREFWAYKHNQCSSFCIPDDLIVLRSLMAFFVKPFGFDQIDRYAQNKGIEYKEYGYMLRGALVGYSTFPKTFTDALYANNDIYIPMDECLTAIHEQVETQYPCD